MNKSLLNLIRGLRTEEIWNISKRVGDGQRIQGVKDSRIQAKIVKTQRLS